MSIRESRKQQRLKEGKPGDLDGNALEQESAFVFDLLLKDLARTQTTVGQTMLAAMWQMYRNEYYKTVFECETLYEYVCANIPETVDSDYVRGLARSVETIMKFVFDAEQKGKPVLDPDTQLPITVDLLISKPGLVSKIRENSAHFAGLKDDRQREEMVVAIATKARPQVKAVKKQQQIANGKFEPIIVVEKFNTKTKLVSILLKDMTEEQAAWARRVLKPHTDPHLDAKGEIND